MRLIDADELMDILPEENVDARMAVLFAPTVDPVIRCKDCKHRDVENGFCEGRGWPMQLVPDDGFCDKGERREDG